MKRIPPLHILLAEDDEINRKIAVRMLEKEGHRITVARNGHEAVEAVENYRFDLILMDVQMPGMDGIEAASTIRKREESMGGHIPIIALTAFGFNEDRDRCLRAGMDGYISKPVRKEELIETIAGLIALPEEEMSDTVFNKEKALELVDGDKEFLKELAGIFSKDSPDSLLRIKTAIDSNNHRELMHTVHKLKTELISFGAEAAFNRVYRLEVMGRNGDLSLAVEEYDALKMEIEGLYEALAGFIKGG